MDGKKGSRSVPVDKMFNVLQKDTLYYEFKKACQDEVDMSSVCTADIKKQLKRFCRNSEYSVKLQNEVYKLLTRPENHHRSDTSSPISSKEPLNFLIKAQAAWEKCIIKSINSMCTELALPLARRRSKKHQEEFSEKFNSFSLGSDYDEEAYKKLRPVYSSADFFETLITAKSSNLSTIRKSSNGWGLVNIQFETKDIHQLQIFFKHLDGKHCQCGVDDLMDGVADGFTQEWYKLGKKVIAKGHSAAARQYAKQGCHAGLRKDLWTTIFGFSLNELDSLRYEQLKSYVFQYDLLVDHLIMKDVRLTTTNDDAFFVFEDLLYQILLVFSRDAELVKHFESSSASPPKSYIRGKLGMPEFQVFYPPSGVIPFHGFAMYAAPLCYIYSDAMTLYYVFREMYVRYFRHLNTISSNPKGILTLCHQFEELLQSKDPMLFKHFIDIGAQPLRVIFNWIMFAFSGYLGTDQTLQLWDRIIAYDSLEILPVLAVAILYYRRDNLISVTTVQAVEAILADISTVKVMPLLITCLSGEKQ